MALLMVVATFDGFVVISDRKETYANRPPKNVKKYHMDKKGGFYISLAGDGDLARKMLDRLGRVRTGPADVVRRIRSVASVLAAKKGSRSLRVDGILIIAGRQGIKLYDIVIAGSHVDVLENDHAVSVRGDADAQALCRYIAKKVMFSGRTREAVARMMLVLANDVAGDVESVGGQSCGFDLGLFVADGRATMLEQLTGEFGRIDVRLRLDESMPLADHGGCLQ